MGRAPCLLITQFHIPEAGILLLLGVDHFLDMGRSATNVLGNAIASCVVSRSEGALDEAMDDEAWARQQAAQVAAPVALHPAEASES